MSKRNKRKRLIEHSQPIEHTRLVSSGVVGTFGNRVGVDMRNVNDLMNWLIFGNDKHFYDKGVVSDNSF